ncbi:MAG: hypothetical protein ACE366_23385 [Bradymonadia bacterium]
MNLFALLWVASCCATAHGQIQVVGAINAETTWNTAGSAYQIDDTLTIQAGPILTIEAGVRVQVGDNNSASVQVLGAVDVTSPQVRIAENCDPEPAVAGAPLTVTVKLPPDVAGNSALTDPLEGRCGAASGRDAPCGGARPGGRRSAAWHPGDDHCHCDGRSRAG